MERKQRAGYLFTVMMLLSLLLATQSLAASNDVAYVSRNPSAISNAMIDALDDLGLNVVIVDDSQLSTTDFSQYALLLVGDEYFPNEGLIPVNEYPSLVLNTAHVDDWGLADALAQISSSGPLWNDVNPASHYISQGFPSTFQVYTTCCSSSGLNLPYYFIEWPDAPFGTETITNPTFHSYHQVVTTYSPGITLRNGQTALSKTVFFGITKADYWTAQTRELFQRSALWLIDNGQPPAILGLSLSDITTSSADIDWTTNTPADSMIEYGLTLSLGQSESSSTIVLGHSLTLSGLVPATTYHYKVISCDLDSQCVSSPTDTFTTIDPVAPVISDIDHVTASGSSSVSFYWQTDKLADSLVRIWKSGESPQEISSSSFTQTHALSMNLVPLTFYHYELESCNVDNYCSTSAQGDLILLDGFDTDGPQFIDVSSTGLSFDKNSPLMGTGIDITLDVVDDFSIESLEYWIEDSSSAVVCDSSCFDIISSTFLSSPGQETYPSVQENLHFETLLDDGTYTIMFEATDLVGNSETYSLPGMVLSHAVDITQPSISGLSVDDVTNHEIALSWETDDPTNGVFLYNIVGEGTEAQGETGYTTSHSFTLTGLADRASYEIILEACNDDGLCGYSDTLEVETLPNPDNEGPAITILYPADGEQVSDPEQLFGFEATDYNEIEICRIRLNGLTEAVFSNVAQGTPQEALITLPETNNDWYVKCEDSEGNEAETAIRTIGIAVMPEITGLTHPSTVEEGEDFQIKFKARDENDDILFVEVYENGELLFSDSDVNDNDLIVLDMAYGYEESGSYSIEVYVQDSQAQVAQEFFDIDVEENPYVVINEFVVFDNDTATVEFYNNGDHHVDIWDLSLELTGSGQTLAITTPVRMFSGDFAIFEFPFTYGPDEEIRLIAPNGVIADSVAFGLFDDGDESDNAPGPVQDDSFPQPSARMGDGEDTEVDSDDFILLARPTLGYENDHTLDDDGDGYDFDVDCDDLDDTVNPGMTEIPGNGKDDDCDATTLDNDFDFDQVDDSVDNCLGLANPDQLDGDTDGIGDACDLYPQDHDNDGWSTELDCDDDNVSINPGLEEIYYNGFDDDCDALTIDDDQDGDGADHTEDCDDLDDRRSPYFTEEYYDGVDNDCDALTIDDDQDSDGWIHTAECLDTDPEVNPGMTEIPGNGKDDDCDPSTPDGDFDFDGVDDTEDNCLDLANPGQEDEDGDGIGDACDAYLNDHDNDGSETGDDCNDDDPTIHPGAYDPIDDIDQNCVDDAPLLMQPFQDRIAFEDEILVYDLNQYFADPEGDHLTFWYEIQDSFYSVELVEGVATLTPPTDAYDNIHARFAVMDGSHTTESDWFLITVQPVNDAPQLHIPDMTIDEDTPIVIDDLNDFAHDTEGDFLLFLPKGESGGVTCSIDGEVLTITPAQDFFGEASCTIQATDGVDYSEEDTFNITVEPVNDAPVLADPIPAQAWTEDNSHVLDLRGSGHFTDVDDEEICYDADDTANIHVDVDDCVLTFTPTPEWSGHEDILIIAYDSHDALTFSNPVTLTVLEENDAPVFTSTPVTSVLEDEYYSYFAEAYDKEGQELTFSLDQAPDGLGIDPYVGEVSGISENSDVGFHHIILRVTDAGGAYALQEFDLEVINVNDAPEFIQAIPDQVWDEDTNLTIDLSVYFNDIDPDDSLCYLIWDTDHVQAEVDYPGDCIITLIPDQEWSGSEETQAYAEDGEGERAHSNVFNLTVLEMNDVPIMEDVPDQILEEDETRVLELSGYSSDAEGSALIYVLTQESNSHIGCEIGSETGTMTITPEPDYHGEGSCTVKVGDGEGFSQPQSIGILVNRVNDLPETTAIPDQSWLQYTYAYIDLDHYFDDADDDELEYGIETAPVHVYAHIEGSLVTLATMDDFHGMDSIRFLAEDDDGATVLSNLVSLEVIDVNDPPVIISTPVTTATEDVLYLYQLEVRDPDDSNLTFLLIEAPEGIILDPVTGLLGGIPSNDDVGYNHVKIRVEDPEGLFDEQEFSIYVENVNDDPFLDEEIPDQEWYEDTTHMLDLADHFGDIDVGDDLSATWTDVEDIMVVYASSSKVKFIPKDDFNGERRITFFVSDRDGATAHSNEVTLRVLPVNDYPVMGPLPIITVTEGDLIEVHPTATDIDGDAIVFHFDPPLDEDGRWQTGFDDAGTYESLITADDGNGGYDTQSQFIIVEPFPNDPPVIEIDDITVTEGELVEAFPVITDPEGDYFTFWSEPRLDENGRWQTERGDFGVYTETIHAEDAYGSSSKSFTITVLESFNNPPEIEPLEDRTMTEGDTIIVTPVANDVDGDPITFSFSPPMDESGEWTASFTDAGVYVIIVTASDGRGGEDSTSFTLTVQEAGNQPPELEPIADISVEEGQPVTVTAVYSDPDGDELTITYSAPLDDAGFWQTGYQDAGTYPASVTVSDGEFTVIEEFTIIVQEVGNHAPTISVRGLISVYEGDLVDLSITASDPDGDDVELTITKPLDAQGNWQTSKGDAGEYIVTVTASDGEDTSTMTFTLEVLEEPYQDLFIKRIVVDDYDLQANGDLRVHVTLENTGNEDMDDLTITGVVHDLGMYDRIGPFDLKDGRMDTRTLWFNVPPYAPPGLYDLRLTFSTDGVRRVVYRDFLLR